VVERTIFVEQGDGPNQQMKVVVTGAFDATMLEALANFVTRQKRRMGRQEKPS
jgi:hypothetical protein